ncbi:molybdopterin synthase sulfur carrier subunit [Paraoerskovia sediminicola]|uniref:Molybdopterin synthase sulfur carrier subunit n=1 Tax=Paraoerskovia sediminicola TaxID=1138587 RepID=A0ABM8G2Y1_9CELL|nr:MoaD/ThiS family protein [Paraoerskovia sediminicola]BDZ42399.1 molybdopterin synthase sulfur carrier subunit [Paraoerskovia sediminicola]
MALVRYFAGARDAAGTESEQRDATSLGELLDGAVRDRPGLTEVLPRCSLLVDGVRRADRATTLGPDAVVDVLPPFAGG